MKKTSVEIVSRDTKHRGWATFHVAQVRLGDGTIIKREIEDHGNAACVLPYDPVRKTAVLVRQERAAVVFAGGTEMLIEPPAGLIDPGEDPLTAAQREALEETGIRIATLEPVATTWTMPGVSTERMSMFLGAYSEADRVNAGGGIDTEHEQIEVIEMPLRELAAMADAGTLTDLKAFTLVQTLRLRRPELFG
jgi:nudix-type nucleoside diphosphatase (YffH/AdpP family)